MLRTIFVILRALACFLCLFTLMACDNSPEQEEAIPLIDQIQGSPTPEQLIVLEENTTLVSGIGTPNADGTFPESLTTIFKGSFKNPEGHGYALELGQDDTAFSAYAGLLPSPDPSPLPMQGIAAMHGNYSVIEVGKSDGERRDFGEPETTTGRITLRADFTFKTLQGSDDFLTVDGEFNGNAVTEDVFFNMRPATLVGSLGSDHAVGVFHGTDDVTAYIGGFLVER
jgi:hypothetical protein